MALKERSTFKWTIKNFDMCPQATGECLESPAFRNGRYRFCLRLYPRGDESVEYVSVFLSRLDDCGDGIVMYEYALDVVNGRGLRTRDCYMVDSVGIFKSSSDGRARIKRDLLLTLGRDELLPMNNLTVQCTVSLSKNWRHNNDNDFRDVQDSETLSQDFAKLLKTGMHSDITILVGGSEFKVHGAILACRCPKLMNDLKETTDSNEFTLPGIEPPVLQAFLQYLYSGTFRDWHLYKEIFIISGTYELPELRNELIFPYSCNMHASTEIDVSRATFKWVIKDFGKLQTHQELVTPISSYIGDKEVKIILSIAKKQTESERLELKFQKICGDIAFIRFKISFFGENDSVAPVCVKEYSQEFRNENWTTPIDLGINLGEIISDDTLSMFFEISLASSGTTSKFEEICINSKTQEPGVEVVKHLTRLQNDMRKLRRDKMYPPDVTLCVEGKNYLAHRAILSARSPYFARRFEQDTLERKVSSIDIVDVDSVRYSINTFYNMLFYIYTGYKTFRTDVSEVIGMYAAAAEYELSALKDECATFLKSSDEAKHVGDILFLADRHHDESLKKSVCDYIAANPKKVLRSKKGLGDLKSRSDVYSEIVKVLLEHLSLSKEDESPECFND